MEQDLSVLGDSELLGQHGVILNRDKQRGYLVSRLDEIPHGVELRSTSGTVVERRGNVVRVNGISTLDVPFRQLSLLQLADPVRQWEPLPEALVRERILTLLDERSLLRLSATSRWFRQLCTEPVVWMELFACRFGFLPPFAPPSASDSRGFWISRFVHQMREIAAFGSLSAPTLLSDADLAKVVLLGPLGSGKTSLLRSLQSSAVSPPSTVAPSLFVRTTIASGFVGGAQRLCSVKFWDVPGDPRNRSISSVYCFTPDHEVLTSRGYLGLDELKRSWEEVEVATIHPVSHAMQYERASRFVLNAPAVRSLIEFDSGGVSLCVTEEHDLYVQLEAAWSKWMAQDLFRLGQEQPDTVCRMLTTDESGLSAVEVRLGDLRKIEQHGETFCLTVPSGLLVARRGCRAPLVTGNCQSADSICFVFDCDREESLSEVQEWVLALKMSIKSSHRHMVLVCNKYRAAAHVELLLKAQAFARREKMELVTINTHQDRGLAWKLFVWKIACAVYKVDFY